MLKIILFVLITILWIIGFLIFIRPQHKPKHIYKPYIFASSELEKEDSFFTSIGVFTADQIADAIFKAEGGYKAKYLYGIRSVHYKDITEARQICLNTIRNNRARFKKQNKYSDYLEFLASRYCPTQGNLSKAEKHLNGNWLRNVRYFLEKG